MNVSELDLKKYLMDRHEILHGGRVGPKGVQRQIEIFKMAAVSMETVKVQNIGHCDIS